jgi:hypothetical protein
METYLLFFPSQFHFSSPQPSPNFDMLRDLVDLKTALAPANLDYTETFLANFQL